MPPKYEPNPATFSAAIADDGDVLVVINYPKKQQDSIGSAFTNRTLRVHSSKLLSTDSKIFIKNLSDWEQHRAKKRFFKNSAADKLPDGVKYVLDLTPQEEGDEIVALISDLSCSRGVRLWSTSHQRCHIANTLVCGLDEASDPAILCILNTGISPGNASQNEGLNRGFTEWQKGFILKNKSKSRNAEEDVNALRPTQTWAVSSAQLYSDEIPEYCGIRHRVGIERLLEVIEGKEPRLDSALKVWTLSVLAKHFDCTKVVVRTGPCFLLLILFISIPLP